MAIFIEVPVSTSTFRDLHALMVVVRGDCDRKCEGSGHYHSTKVSIKKHAFHFVPFDHSISGARFRSGLPAGDLFQASRVNVTLITNAHEYRSHSEAREGGCSFVVKVKSRPVGKGFNVVKPRPFC